MGKIRTLLKNLHRFEPEISFTSKNPHTSQNFAQIFSKIGFRLRNPHITQHFAPRSCFIKDMAFPARRHVFFYAVKCDMMDLRLIQTHRRIGIYYDMDYF